MVTFLYVYVVVLYTSLPITFPVLLLLWFPPVPQCPISALMFSTVLFQVKLCERDALPPLRGWGSSFAALSGFRQQGAVQRRCASSLDCNLVAESEFNFL